MLRFCVAGAAGRMGNAIISEAIAKGHVIVGATEAANSSCVGKSLCELGIANSDTKILGSDRLGEAVRDADVYVSFTVPGSRSHKHPNRCKTWKTHCSRHYRL